MTDEALDLVETHRLLKALERRSDAIVASIAYERNGCYDWTIYLEGKASLVSLAITKLGWRFQELYLDEEREGHSTGE